MSNLDRTPGLTAAGGLADVAPRPVHIGGASGNQWIVLDGLKPGEQVMVDGFQKLRGNAPVKAVPWTPPSSQAAAAKPGASAPAPASSAPAAAPAASA